MENNNSQICIGIDVSKNTLDIYCNKQSFVINNNKRGINKFIKTVIGSKP